MIISVGELYDILEDKVEISKNEGEIPMENLVGELFTEEILKTGLHLFALENSYIKLGDFENYVFEVTKKDRVYILRVTHQSHRQREDILAELHWVNYLQSSGINVPEVFQSVNGETVEEIEASDGSAFYFCLFSKVNGSPVHVKEERFNEELFFSWGKAIGKIHKATRTYKTAENLKKRPLWNEDDLLVVENYIPESDGIIISRTKELLQELADFPTTKEHFGLIHGDIHSGNFFFDGSEIHIFDFDDSSYHWFASDLAIPLYYSVFYRYSGEKTQERNLFGQTFITAFTKGYETETKLPPQWKEHLPYMLRLRDVTLYSVLYKKIPVEHRTERILKMLEEIGSRIKNKEPIVWI